MIHHILWAGCEVGLLKDIHMINITHMYGIARMILVAFVLACLSNNSIAKHDESVTTPRLIVRDKAGIKPEGQFEQLAQ